MRRPSRRISRVLGFTVVPVSLVATGLFVTASSYSVFNATTNNTGNNWTAGQVHLSDDDGSDSGTGAAMFTTSSANIQPNSAGSRCIVVKTNAGDLPAKIGIYSDPTTYNQSGTGNAAFAAYLKLKVEMANSGTTSTGTFSNSLSSNGTPACTFTGTTTTIYDGTIAGFNTAQSNYTSAVSTAANVWQTNGGASAESRVYRFTWSFPSNATAPTSPTDRDNQYQGKTTGINFIWESQTF